MIRIVKKLLFLISCSLLIFSCADSGKKINYGSNNGNYVTIQGVKIYYEEYGSGAPVLVLHPGLGSIENLGQLIGELSKQYHVIAYDAPGHGRSEQADSIGGELLAYYAGAIIDRLHLDSVYVFGWSTGGNTALWLAATRPDKVKKVVSGASNSKASGLTKEAKALYKEFTIEAVIEDGDWLKHYQELSPQPDQWKKFWADNQKSWAREIKIPDEKLKSIEAPVLIIRGDRDMITPEHSIEMHRMIANSQLCIYPGAGHDMPETNADALADIVLGFFGK